jgi:amino acid adenylation domain-containing protein/FkbM family methyltransferase
LVAVKLLHRLIEQQAARAPHATAVVFEDQRLTYAELERRANVLARRLIEMGARPDSLIALQVERSLGMVVAILGILKAGAAYLPIDAAYPHDRIAYLLEDAKPGLVLTQSTLDGLDWDGAGNRVDAAVRPEHLAYVIYTSGSTGRPKGVCIEHRNIAHYVCGIAQRLRLDAGMQHASVSTIAADLGNTVLFPALATGGCLHVVSEERAQNPALLAEYFERERIDVLKIVPSHLQALQAGAEAMRIMPRRRLVLGGEASRRNWIEYLRAGSPQCEIHNHYGPTETTVGVLTYEVGADLPATRSGTLPLGKPLPGCRIYLLDEDLQPVRDGEEGELHIAGGGVARGYLNRPELTAEKFIDDPFDGEEGRRMYRTGDRARGLPDGSIEFCGRNDHQVKLHGYRVELGEIEAALREQPAVRDAVVLAPEDESGGRQLVAYVVPKRADQPLWNSGAVHVLPDGTPVAHLNRNETDYIYNEIFVLKAYVRHGITIRDGDCIVDAGANIGLFTVYASRLARGLRVLSFEPSPSAFACLKANAEAWGSDVQCLPLGLSRANSSAQMTFFEGLSLLSGFYADAATEKAVVERYVFNQQAEPPQNGELAAEMGALIDERLQARTVTAELRRLSSVIAERGIERIDLLKINVEKSELDVLLGIDAADWAKIAQLVIEVDLAENLAPITRLLEQHGFECLVEQDPLLRNTELCYVYAIRPEGARRLIPGAPAPASAQVGDHGLLTHATLRRALKARLPLYMLPASFVMLGTVPLTSNGKIDRGALAALSSGEASAARDLARPLNDTEKALAAIWTDLLKIDRVGPDDDFFDLGGRSLLAIQVVSRVREVFGVDLALRNLFEQSTLAGLAAVVDELAWLAKPPPADRAGVEREEIVL